MPRAPFQVLVYPYIAVGEDFEYALFKRADKGYWQTVAGGGEDHETPLQAAHRELWEETGLPTDTPLLQLQTIEPIPVTEFKDSHLWGDAVYVIPQYCFGAAASTRELRLSHEHSEYRWLPYPAALPLIPFDGNRTALWELHQRLHHKGPRD
jgi:dihydroneopterin triphosphate diphosphatase